MASLRRQRKAVRSILAAHLLALLATFAPAGAATTEQVVSDWRSGVAIDGVDPVAYFTDARRVLGQTVYEYRHAGVTWRFHSDGNRAAFASAPSVYMPQFGGYDPVALARGVPAPGDPELWLIVEQRLYLFNNAQTREAFAGEPHAGHTNAAEKWPEVLRKLVP